MNAGDKSAPRPKPSHPKASRYAPLLADVQDFRTLENRIAALPTEKERGDAFEVFAEAYCATQPAERAKQVHALHVPPTIRRKLGLPTVEKGLDGIIETNSGTCRGYQVKFRSNRTRLTWTDVATFFGISDRCDERMLFTNAEDVSEVTAERLDFSSIRGSDLDALELRDFKAIETWLKGAQVVRKRKTPYGYQAKAIEKTVAALRKVDRATVVMACGTGKTQVSLWIAEKVAEQTVLVLVPSLALLNQTLEEWLKETAWATFDYLCVCSDPSVNKMDEVVIRPTELEFPVSTDPIQVRKFLQRPFKGMKIVFCTYQSADVVGRGMPKGFRFDLSVFDEAHKTAGAMDSQFSYALSDDNLPIRKRLFLTATPRHYNLNRKDRNGDPIEVFSMNRPEIYGSCVHKLGFAEASKKGIICRYKVLISVVTSQSIERQTLARGRVQVRGKPVRAAQVANQIALAQAVKKYGLQKLFTFHRTVDSAKSFVADGSEGVGNHLRDFGAFHVNGAMPTADRRGIMREFEQSPKALISNARCLTEGINVPAVDMVAFLTPKRSKVDIVQATGRAMRKDPNNRKKTTGYILVPLYIEIAKSETLAQAIERTKFDEVWAVLQAMQEQDDVLDTAIQYVEALGEKVRGFNEARIKERVEIIGPRIKVAELKRAISTRCIERLARPWDVMVQQLLRFKKRFGHMNVPRDAKPSWKELGEWVWNTRQAKRREILSAERVVELDGLGFNWRVEGQTLDDTTGLLNEKEFRNLSGLGQIGEYRKRGLIKPVGWAASKAGLSAFYRPRQVKELKKKLGITLEDTSGLLNESEFAEACGFALCTTISKYRKQGLIKPVGWATALGSALSAYYHPRQVKELKKKLGITLDDTTGLLNEGQFAKLAELSRIVEYRKQGLIKPVGWAISNAGLSAFYHPRQAKELKNKLGITLDDTTGLLNEPQFREASELYQITQYRRRGLIKPVGWAMTLGSTLSALYHPRQVKELKNKLGITLDGTTGLLNEGQFAKLAGFSGIAKYRKRGLIKPVGWAMSKAGISSYYHPRQAKELKKKLGITLDDTTGLISERQFAEECGLATSAPIVKYRKQGVIKPLGWAITTGPGGLSAFYHPRQIKELKKKLGVTLENTTGLLNENEFSKASGLSLIKKYRQQGLIKPVGWAMTNKFSAFYHPRQIKELKKKLGVTLSDTTGLLSEPQFKKASGLSQIAKYRNRGLIKPVGWAITTHLTAYYRSRQIKEFKKKLGLTLNETTGLLSEPQFEKASGLSQIAKYRNRGLIKPVGWAITSGSMAITAYYRSRQIKEFKKKLGITLNDTTGLLNESQFEKASGLSRIAKYRKQGLISPVGWALSSAGLSSFYDPRQAKELKKKLGITLDDTSGLLNEKAFAKACGMASGTTVSNYRKKGVIKPIGWARASGTALSAFYHPRQIKELKKKLGVTLENTTGLLNENEFSKASGLSLIKKYRQQGLIKPVGWAMARGPGGLSAYYHPRQIKELKRNLAELRGMKARNA